MIVHGGLPIAAVESPTHARVSDHQQDWVTVRLLLIQKKGRLRRLNRYVTQPYALPLTHAPVAVGFLSPPHDLTMTSECQCHGHADSCHFSQRAWLSSGLTSGGICDDCRHNTVGRRCQRCRHGYHRRPSLPLNSPHTCTRKRHRMGTGEGCHWLWHGSVFNQSEKKKTKKGAFVTDLILVELQHQCLIAPSAGTWQN